MKLFTMNTSEPIPEEFYIFTNRHSTKLINQVEAHNIGLREGTLVSSGIFNACSEARRELFIKGDLDYLPFVKGNPTTVGNVSPFLSRITERYTLEYNLEVCRMQYFKEYPSRFSCIYAFGDFEACKRISNSESWDINSVKKYKLVDMGPFNDCIKIVKTNFKIIGALEHYGMTALIEQNARAFEQYWSGEGKITIPEFKEDEDIVLPEKKCGVMWEYLIEGVLEEVH